MEPTQHLLQQHIDQHHPQPIQCPHCTWSHPCTPTTPAHLRDHLRQSHPTATYHQISTAALTASGLHICRICNRSAQVYAHPSQLHRHHTTSHTSTNQASRDQTNLELVLHTYKAATPTQWQSSLLWLHQLSPKPVPYRTNLWHKLTARGKAACYSALAHVYD